MRLWGVRLVLCGFVVGQAKAKFPDGARPRERKRFLTFTAATFD